MTVQLDAGEAIVKAAKGAGLDPREFRQAMRKAGFTLRRIHAEIVGVVRRHGEKLVLEMPGAFHEVALGGKTVTLEVMRQSQPMGRSVRVEGLLHLPPEVKTASVDVVSWILEAAL